MKSAAVWLVRNVASLRDRQTPFSSWEMIIMRAAFATLVLWSLTKEPPPASQPFPNGLCHFFQLAWLAQPEALGLAKWITALCLVAFAVGLSAAVTLPLPVFIYISVGSLINSQGAIKHYDQLIAMVLLAFWLAALWSSIGRLARVKRIWWFDDLSQQRFGIYWVMVAIAAGYVTSAISKLFATGGAWIFWTPNLAVQLVKSHLTVFYDTISTAQTMEYPALAGFLVEHVWVAPLLFGPGLFVELLFFLSLAGRAWALFFGCAGIAMHIIIALVMRLGFPEHEALLLIFFVNAPYWVMLGIGAALPVLGKAAQAGRRA